MSGINEESMYQQIRNIVEIAKTHENKDYFPELLDNQLLKFVNEKATEIFKTEENIIKTTSKVIVVGDLHGQLQDLLQILHATLDSQENYNYVLLGDYVDRGKTSVEVISLLLCFKILSPKRFTVLRGNHESRKMTAIHGFKEECENKCGKDMYDIFCNTFDSMPLAAIIDDKVFCVHGGISKDIHTLDDIYKIDRFCEVPKEGAMTDMLWSDPNIEVEEFEKSHRGLTFYYGEKSADKFLANNHLEYIIRAHEVADNGYDYPFENNKVITIFSASNYSKTARNEGAYMIYSGQIQIVILPRHASALPTDSSDYDLDDDDDWDLDDDEEEEEE